MSYRILVEPAAAQRLRTFSSHVVQRLGLVESLGMMRMRRLHAILHAIRRQIYNSLQRKSSNRD